MIPMIYDPTIDESRPVTQEDVDAFLEQNRRMLRLRGLVLKMVAEFPSVTADLVCGSKERDRLIRESRWWEKDAPEDFARQVRVQFNIEHSNG